MNQTVRIEQTVALLETRYDLLPGPSTWRANPLHHRPEPGAPAPSLTVPCGKCAATGRMKNLRPCLACGGNPGKGKAGRGYLVVDEYTGQEVRTIETEEPMSLEEALALLGGDVRDLVRFLQDPEGRRCDGGCLGTGRWPNSRLCPTCSGTGRLAAYKPRPILENTGTDQLDSFLHKLAQRDRAGSWAELERALDQLRARSVPPYRLVVRCHVTQQQPLDELAVRDRARLAAALVFLAERMPDPIVVPSWAKADRLARARRDWLHRGRDRMAEASRRRRDRMIVDLHGAEVGVGEIAERVCLSPSMVYEVLARADASAGLATVAA